MARLHTCCLIALTVALAAAEVRLALALPPAAWVGGGVLAALAWADNLTGWRDER